MRWEKLVPVCILGAVGFTALVGSQLALKSNAASGGGRRSSHDAEAATTTALINADAAKPRFDGTINGWRLAPYDRLKAEGVDDRNLSRSKCEPTSAGAETKTTLDFILSYEPPGLKIESSIGPTKWVCGSEGLSVAYDYNLNGPIGVGELWAEQALWGRRSQEVFVANDRVAEGSINGKPAIFIHPIDDATGLGFAEIIVIENDESAPYKILRITSNDAIPFDQLVKIAEGAR